MAETMSWRSLELGERDLPRLLVKTRLNKDGYDIQLTDLGRIWGERIGKREIVERANDEGCSIDPSEDDQYGILLKKIESALKGDPRTTLDLHSHKDTDTLQLDLSAPLPGSLPTFVWSIKLERQPDAVIGTGLVTPLISQAVQLRGQIQHLIDELASKDRVIAKITDRLEASGNDLTAVFPGASGIKISRKKSQRGQLASHVKGLADFDEGVWRNSVKQSESSVNLSSDILNSVLEHLPIASTAALEGNWWVDCADSATKRQPQSRSAASKASQRGGSAASQRQFTTANAHLPLSTEQSVDEDEFQRQGTPPQLKKVDEPPAGEDEETDDEDLDNPPSKASSSQTKGRSQQHDEPKSTPAARRLGILGGRKSKSPRPNPPHETESEPEAETEDEEPSAPKPTARGKLGAFGGKRAASPESARDLELEPEPELLQQSPAKIKSRLGTFGGSSRAAVVSAEPADLEQHETRSKPKLGTFGGKGKGSADSASVKAEQHDDEAPPSPVKGKLGRMGGKGGDRSEETEAVDIEAAAAEERARDAEEKAEQERQEREDSQERADKKRERLKRELEEKAKGPTKKKRKF